MAALDAIIGAVLSTRAIIVGILQDTSQVGTSAIATTTLHTYTVPAGGLAVNGDLVRFDYVGTMTATALGNRIFLDFGATTIFDTGTITPGVATAFRLYGFIIRTGAATQKVFAQLDYLGSTGPTYTTCAETLSGALALAIKADVLANNDIVKEIAIIDVRGTAT